MSMSTVLFEYSNLGEAIRGTCREWCCANNYSHPFCQDGEWWAFPSGGVMPVKIKTVMYKACGYWVKIGPMTLALFPDGSLVRDISTLADEVPSIVTK